MKPEGKQSFKTVTGTGEEAVEDGWMEFGGA